MHDIGAIVWVILVLIGVISSLRKSAQRSRARGAASRVQQPTVRAQAFVPVPAPAAPPPPVPPPVPAPVVAAQVVAAPSSPTPPAPVSPAQDSVARIGTERVRGMFEGAALVRAIVAAEVLGPPKSLQEQTIWSPRHSEPSI
jgi:hypothetical protein